MTGRDIFNNALRMMSVEEGSEVVREFLASLDLMGMPGHDESGVSDEFLDNLERVDVATLPATADCPICTNRFADNDHPLLVKLPCQALGQLKKLHIFDMECIAPWLKVHPTCPMCRFNVHDAEQIRRKRLEDELRQAREDDDEEEEEDDDRDLYG